jgi:hypothetical protein
MCAAPARYIAASVSSWPAAGSALLVCRIKSGRDRSTGPGSEGEDSLPHTVGVSVGSGPAEVLTCTVYDREFACSNEMIELPYLSALPQPPSPSPPCSKAQRSILYLAYFIDMTLKTRQRRNH